MTGSLYTFTGISISYFKISLPRKYNTTKHYVHKLQNAKIKYTQVENTQMGKTDKTHTNINNLQSTYKRKYKTNKYTDDE